jgi:hypothetical protein
MGVGPLATTVSVAVAPELIVEDPGCVVILGRTEIVDDAESTLPELLLTRTQYVVLLVSAGVVKLDELVPTGVAVTPTAP